MPSAQTYLQWQELEPEAHTTAPRVPAHGAAAAADWMDLSAATSYHALLGVSRSAGQPEIKAAYRALLLRCHPDCVPPAERHVAEERVKALNAAYSALRCRETV